MTSCTTGEINTPSRIKVRMVQIMRLHRLMMMGWMVLGEVVGVIVFTFLPMHIELPLFDAVTRPIITHVNGLGAFLLDGVIDDAFGTRVVGLDWCGRLRVAKVLQGGAEYTSFLCIVEDCTNFCFSGGS